MDQRKRKENGVVESVTKTGKKKKSLTVLFLCEAKRLVLDEKWERYFMGALSMKVIHARSAAEHEKSGVLLYRVA